MLNIMSKWFPLFLLFIVFPVQAEVYKWTTPDGVIHYSDTPHPEAQKMALPKSQSSALGKAAGGYSAFSIEQPTDGETLRSAEGRISIGLSLEPGLQEGHTIRLLVDGTAMEQDINATQFSLENIPRGSHTLQAHIIDSNGVTLKSTSVQQFHLRQPAVN